MGYSNLKTYRSPKSKEAYRVTKRQLLWLSEVIRKQPGLKNYCMIKRLVLYATNKKEELNYVYG